MQFDIVGMIFNLGGLLVACLPLIPLIIVTFRFRKRTPKDGWKKYMYLSSFIFLVPALIYGGILLKTLLFNHSTWCSGNEGDCVFQGVLLVFGGLVSAGAGFLALVLFHVFSMPKSITIQNATSPTSLQ